MFSVQNIFSRIFPDISLAYESQIGSYDNLNMKDMHTCKSNLHQIATRTDLDVQSVHWVQYTIMLSWLDLNVRMQRISFNEGANIATSSDTSWPSATQCTYVQQSILE